MIRIKRVYDPPERGTAPASGGAALAARDQEDEVAHGRVAKGRGPERAVAAVVPA